MSARDPETLPVVRAADLDEADPARRWLVEPLWTHGGVGTIGGLPKCLKSWLGLDLAVSVASGTPCLDTFPVTDPGGVLLYMAEDAAPLVKARTWHVEGCTGTSRVLPNFAPRMVNTPA
jgi:hypothetical protein